MGRTVYTNAHEQSYQTGKKEMEHYDDQFRPIVEKTRQEALGWDSVQRHQASQNRASNSTRLGIRQLMMGAGANSSNIIRNGVYGANVTANDTVKGDQVTGWQRLGKLGAVAGHARQQKNTADGQMMIYGNMTSSFQQTKEAIKTFLSEQKSALAGQVIGAAAGLAAGSWWQGAQSGGQMVDGAGGGVGSGNTGVMQNNARVNGSAQMYS